MKCYRHVYISQYVWLLKIPTRSILISPSIIGKHYIIYKNPFLLSWYIIYLSMYIYCCKEKIIQHRLKERLLILHISQFMWKWKIPIRSWDITIASPSLLCKHFVLEHTMSLPWCIYAYISIIITKRYFRIIWNEIL